jgi:hypothetical protein
MKLIHSNRHRFLSMPSGTQLEKAAVSASPGCSVPLQPVVATCETGP